MEQAKDILEIIYFMSGPVIAIFAFMALHQIKIAKQQLENDKNILRINSKRESIKLATEQCNIYMKKIIPDINILDKSIKTMNIDFYQKSKVNITQEEISITPYIKKDDYNKTFKEPLISQLLKVLNELETFSIYFNAKIADEKIAYMSIGKTYYNTVENLLPDIIMHGKGDHFQNIIQLFTLWYFRLKQEKMESEKQKLEKELGAIKTYSTNPIGVNI